MKAIDNTIHPAIPQEIGMYAATSETMLIIELTPKNFGFCIVV